MRTLFLLFFCLWAATGYAQYPRIGNVLQNSDGTKGVVFFVSPDGSGGWMVALHDLEPGHWSPPNTDVPELPNLLHIRNFDEGVLKDTFGYRNTLILRDFLGPGNSYAAQKVNFNNGWYLPAVGQAHQLKMEWTKIKPIILAEGGEDLIEKLYWTSSEADARNSWGFDGNIGVAVGSIYKDWSLKTVGIRPIRSFTNTNLSYKWNTGETTPSVTVSPNTTTDYEVTMTSAEGWSTSASQKIVVNPSPIIDLYDTISKGESYDFRGQVVTEQKVYYDSLKTILGCDSIYRLHLTVNSTSQPNITIQATAQEICDGEQVTLSVRKTWAVGDILCTDGTAVKREEYARSGKTAKGVVFWISPDETHGWAVHLQEELYRKWSTAMVDIPDLPNIDFDSFERCKDTAGYQNTKIIRESGDSTMFPAAYSVDFEHDWYLPAARQTLFLQAKLSEINKSLIIIPEAILIEGTLLYENQRYYAWSCWSSTEIDDSFVIGGDMATCKNIFKTRTDIRTRAVCTFKINKP